MADDKSRYNDMNTTYIKMDYAVQFIHLQYHYRLHEMDAMDHSLNNLYIITSPACIIFETRINFGWP